MVSHNEKAVSGDYDILKVASGTFAKVRVCPPQVGALQLGSLPGSMAS